MSSATCWQCLIRRSVSSSPPQFTIKPTRTALFSSFASLQAQVKTGPPKKGERVAFSGGHRRRKAKARIPGKPPAPGERKAIRKRVVLSNSNALPVAGIETLSVESIVDQSRHNQVLSLPGEVVDSLRALDAFKPSQSWSLSNRPSVLVTKETTLLAKQIRDLPSGEMKRRIIVGPQGSGKSVTLLQVATAALLNDWVIVSIPEAFELVAAIRPYGPLQGSRPPQYIQKQYTAELLQKIASANSRVLSNLRVSKKLNLPVSIEENASLQRLCQIGAADRENSWHVFQAFWSEITRPSTEKHPRPKILMMMDGLAHAMRPSAYMSPKFEPIHAHDIVLISWFMDYLSAKKILPNGGFVITATKGHDPNVPALQLRLSQIERQQELTENPESPTTDSLMAPFLRATDQSVDRIPPADPWKRYDQRVLDVFDTNSEVPIEVHRMKGLEKAEARGLMEYWAKNGLIRSQISDTFVNEKWSLAGNGLVGELEKGCVRMRA